MRWATLLCLPSLLFLHPASIAWSAPRLPPASLSETERSRLRLRLEDLLSDVELLLRNRKSTQADLRRQQKEFDYFSVFKRIPFEEEFPALRKELEASAAERGLELRKVQIIGRSRPGPPPPAQIFTDLKPFRFSNDQLVEELTLRVEGKGPAQPVLLWAQSLPRMNLRLVELVGGAVRESPSGDWEFQAHAYRFRPARFPKLIPRDPLQLLPDWARKNPSDFSAKEPLLWSRVQQIRALIPQTAEAYAEREQLLLNGARMSFFIAKSPPEEDEHPAR